MSDLRQVGGLLRFASPVTLTAMISYNWIFVENGNNHHNPNP